MEINRDVGTTGVKLKPVLSATFDLPWRKRCAPLYASRGLMKMHTHGRRCIAITKIYGRK